MAVVRVLRGHVPKPRLRADVRVDVAVLVEVRVVVLRQMALRGVGRAERAAQQVVARLDGLFGLLLLDFLEDAAEINLALLELVRQRRCGSGRCGGRCGGPRSVRRSLTRCC